MHVYLDSLPVPSYVTTQSYDDEDVRHLISRTKLLITDYSSIAVNLAYVQRSTVYFQFDLDEFSALHAEREGYFDYHSDEFDPVGYTADEVVSGVESLLSGSSTIDYAERMRRAFPIRDGRNSERVFNAMVESCARKPLSERMHASVRDEWKAIEAVQHSQLASE